MSKRKKKAAFVEPVPAPTFEYLAHPHHRNGMAVKSQWTISIEEEELVFWRVVENAWLVAHCGWGLHVVAGGAQFLGTTGDRRTQLLLAKFVSKAGQLVWHGYPADHQRNQQDIPPTHIQRIWLGQGILSAPKIRKIAKGQPCSL